jgi:SAM-dependent methyltransferase
MAVKPYRKSGGNKYQPSVEQILPSSKKIRLEAEKVEDLLRKLFSTGASASDNWEIYSGQYPKLRSLNSFGKQIVVRMFRSNPAFQGYKVEFREPILKPHVLFLIGTLCEDFDYMNTSPLYGMSVLDIGCGALSTYGTANEDANLADQFYSDRPPVGAELLQILGAQTTGIEPRGNAKEIYDYQVSYKHRVMDFGAIKEWLKTLNGKLDVITCFNLFNRASFAYYYASPHEISAFLKDLRQALNPKGFLYCSAPFLSFSPENKQLNYQVFEGAGLKVVHEGYYCILRPRSK